jgi:hypothetical protein
MEKTQNKFTITYLSRVMTMTSGVARKEVEAKEGRKTKMLCPQCNHGQTNVH